MKNLMIAAFALCLMSATAQAQRNAPAARGVHTLKPMLSFDQGSVAFGVDYEMKHTNTMGVGGYFFYGTGDEDKSVAKTIAFGAFAPIHFFSENPVSLYIAPGFGIAMIDNVTSSGDNETTFGPSYKLGADYAVSPTLKIGAQYFKLFNWFADEAPGSGEYASATVTFGF